MKISIPVDRARLCARASEQLNTCADNLSGITVENDGESDANGCFFIRKSDCVMLKHACSGDCQSGVAGFLSRKRMDMRGFTLPERAWLDMRFSLVLVRVKRYAYFTLGHDVTVMKLLPGE